MKTFKNKNFKTRNYECTNVVFCKAEQAPDDNWEVCHELDLDCSGAIQLYVENGVRYFGWL